MTRNGIILARILLFAGGTTWGGTTTMIAGDDDLTKSQDGLLATESATTVVRRIDHTLRRLREPWFHGRWASGDAVLAV